MGTATATTPTTLLVIEKNEMLRVLHAEHELSDHFIRYMLGHNIRVEEDLMNQLFNSSEKRLARGPDDLVFHSGPEAGAHSRIRQRSSVVIAHPQRKVLILPHIMDS
jgi:CRP-like cAMP-binding protein